MARESWGIIDRQKSGRYRARYTHNGERFPAPATFDTKDAARAWLAVQRVAIAGGTWVHPAEALAAAEVEAAEKARRAITVGEYSDQWINRRLNAGKIGLKQAYSYRILWRGAEPKRPGHRALEPGRLHTFTDQEIGTVTAAQIRDWHDVQLATKKLTAAARAYEHLKTVFNAAVEDEIIQSNPCKIKDAKTSTGKERTPPTDEQLNLLINAMPTALQSLTVMAAAMGGRFGELTALTADDVQVEKNDADEIECVRINVNKAISYVPGEGRSEKSTKTRAGIRTVSVYGDDALIIAAHVQKMASDQLLWADQSGKFPMSHSSFTWHWEKARKVAGRPDLELHSLRHYHGTRYAQLTGASLAEVMARLGHKSVAAAMRYQHAGTRADELAKRAAR